MFILRDRDVRIQFNTGPHQKIIYKNFRLTMRYQLSHTTAHHWAAKLTKLRHLDCQLAIASSYLLKLCDFNNSAAIDFYL
ncbi:MAG: hypothetical protein ACI9OI_001717 [Chitinophagales bacterium]